MKRYILIHFSRFWFNNLQLSIKLFFKDSLHWGQWRTSLSGLDNLQHSPSLPLLPTPSLPRLHKVPSHPARQLCKSMYTAALELYGTCTVDFIAGLGKNLKAIRLIIFTFYLKSTFYLNFYCFIDFLICIFAFY